MVLSGYPRSTLLIVAAGVVVVLAAVAMNVTWLVLHWRTGLLVILGLIFTALIISGVVLNTLFLAREIRRNEHQNAFLNAVTHELKTPLASIRLYLETLQTRTVDEARRREFQDIMIADCDRLLHTIDQVLRAGQGSAARPRLKGVRVNLPEMVADCLKLAQTRHHLPEGALVFANRLPEDAARTVLGDADELRSAIGNLIDNAIKYSQPRVEVYVEVDAVEDDDLVVRVKDRGIGIPKAELKRIFKRFYRIQEAVTRFKGMGLGLFIVNSVARRHGGRVYAESEGRGQGSTFTLLLPAAPPR